MAQFSLHLRTGAWDRGGAVTGKTLLAVALGAFAGAMVVVSQSNFGAGVWVDTVAYYKMAHKLASEGAVTIRYSPPLYAAALSIVHGVFGLPMDWAATWVNALSLGLTVGVVASWVASHGASLLLTAWTTLLCATSVLAQSASMGLTEPLFVALTTLSLFALDRGVSGTSRRKRLWLALATVAAAGTGITRLGVALPLMGTLVLFAFACGTSSRRRRFGIAAAVGTCAVAPALAWFLTWYVAGDPLAARSPFALDDAWTWWLTELLEWLLAPPLMECLHDVIHKLASLGATPPGPDIAWSPFGFALKTVFLCVLGFLLITLAATTRHSLPAAAARSLALIATFLAAYAGFLVVCLLVLDMTFTKRLLIPLYAPGLVMVALILQGCVRKMRESVQDASANRRPRRVFAALGWCAVLGGLAACQGARLGHGIADTYDHARLHFVEGYGYSAKQWRESETARFLRETASPTAWALTAEPAPLEWALNRLGDDGGGLFLVDGVPVGPAHETRRSFTEHRRKHPVVETYVVWFHHLGRPGLASWNEELNERSRHLLDWIGTPGLRVLKGLKDGVVFTLDPAPPPAESGNGAERVLDVSSLKNAVVTAVLDGGRRIHSGQPFDVVLSGKPHQPHEEDRTGGQLVYLFHDCGPHALGGSVFLHVVPVDLADLPPDRARYGFDNLDHQFTEGFRHVYPDCLVVVDLPRYRVKSIHTGQWNRGPEDWSVEIALAPA